MLEYDRIDISKGIGIDICHYWYFKDIGFKYEPYLCNGPHELMQKAMSFNNMMLLFFMFKEMLTEFIFDIWVFNFFFINI